MDFNLFGPAVVVMTRVSRGVVTVLVIETGLLARPWSRAISPAWPRGPVPRAALWLG